MGRGPDRRPLDGQVAQAAQPEGAVAGVQGDAARGHDVGRAEQVQGACVARRLHAVQRIEPAEGRGLQRGLAAQVGDRAAGLVRRGQGRVQGAAHAQLDVAAAGQRQTAVGLHAAGAAHRQHQGLAARIDLAQAVADQAGLLPAGIAAHVHAQVAAAQRAEAGEAAQFVGGLVDVAGHVSAEVDPPGGGLRLADGRRAGSLAPEPVAWRVAVVADGGCHRPAIGRRGCEHHVADQVGAGAHGQVAAAVRIPGAVDALRAAVDVGLEALAGIVRHLAGQAPQARLVVRVAGLGGGRRGAGGIDAVQRMHAQVAAGQQIQVAGAGAQHAEARGRGSRQIILGLLGLAVVGHVLAHQRG